MTIITLQGNAKCDYIRQLFVKASGHFVNLLVEKKTTGEDREMNCRTGVSKHTNGVGLSFDPNKYNLQVVWEANKAGGAESYRMVNLIGVKTMKVNGEEYIFE
jgi:predicted phage-related endonuclease